jgi:DNA-directed RNA polymerase subunit L
MPTFYLRSQKHTLASALREILEEENPDEFVSCTILHPFDEHIVVEAPSEHAVRRALLVIRDKISTTQKLLNG